MAARRIDSRRMGELPEGRLLLNMALPMVLSMLVQALYNIVDSIYVARVSEDCLSALSADRNYPSPWRIPPGRIHPDYQEVLLKSYDNHCLSSNIVSAVSIRFLISAIIIRRSACRSLSPD